jgi:hypothetical protein
MLSRENLEKKIQENLKNADMAKAVRPIFDRLKNDLRTFAQTAPPSERDKMRHYAESLELVKTDDGFAIYSDGLIHSGEEDKKARDLMEYGSATGGIPATNAWANFRSQLITAKGDIAEAVGKKLLEGLFS